jgi:hypothetical protein
MAPSWPAPLFPLHDCHGNLVSAPCTSPLSRLTTTGQTSMTDRPKKFYIQEQHKKLLLDRETRYKRQKTHQHLCS